MKQVVIGIFDNSNEAQDAVQQLIRQGFDNENIDISAQNVREGNLTREGRLSDDDRQDEGFGDRISNFFKSLFGDSDEASNYSEVTTRSRGSIVTVYVESSDQAERAANILDEYGAIDVNERASQYRNLSQTDTAPQANTFTDTSSTNVPSDRSVPIIEEELEVGKRQVRTGGMKLRSRIIERPVEEVLRLRVEHVDVVRNRVNRPATQEDLSQFKEGTIEVNEYAETPIVKKEARVVEEIKLNKEIEEKEETIRETIRKTDVDVKKIDPENQRGNRDLLDEDNR